MSKKLTDEEFAIIASEHGGVECCEKIDSRVGEFVVRTPRKPEMKRLDAMKDGNYDRNEWIARSCIVYPSRDDFDAMTEKMPGLVIVAANAAIRLSGALLDKEGKA